MENIHNKDKTTFISASLNKKLLRGGAWASAGKVAITLTVFAANILLARLLSPEEMGTYFLILSLVLSTTIIAQLGLTRTIVRLVAESVGTDRPARAHLAVLWTIRLAGIGALVMACVMAFGGGAWVAEYLFHSMAMSQVAGLAAVWMVLITFQQLMAEIYRGFHDIRLATIFGGLITGFLSMIMFLGLWFLRGYSDMRQIILITLVAVCSNVALSSLVLWKKLTVLPSPKGDEIGVVEILRISWPLWVTSLALFMLSQSDLWVMGLLRSTEEVAVYGAAVRIVALLTMPILLVNAVVPPLIAEMHAQGETEELEKVLRTLATFAGLPALIMCGLFIFFGDSILGVVFGEYYQVGGVVLTILSIGQLANVWAGSCGLTLMLTGHQLVMMVITVFCGILAVVGGVWFVQLYGGIGVAGATATGMFLQNLLMLFFAKKKVGVWTHVKLSLIKNVWKLLRIK